MKKRMKGFMTLISLALVVRVFLSIVISKTTLAHAPYEKEFHSLFQDRIKVPLPVERSNEYCNFPGQKIEGLEGKTPDSGMKLLGTVLLVRHGDRLPISRPPAFDGFSAPERKPCSLDPSVTPTNSYLGPFIESISKYNSEMRRSVHPALRNFDFLPDTCSDVSVTQSGIVQMLELGDFLGQRYLKNNQPGDQQPIVISTSRFARTFQSLLSFVYGFSPERFQELVSGNIDTSSSIYFCDGDLHSSPSFSTHCDCARAKMIPQLRASFRDWDQQNPYISYLHDLLQIDKNNSKKKVVASSMQKIGPPPLSVASPSRIWDWLVSEYYCPGRPLPCVPDEFGRFSRCINSSVIEELVHLVDKNHLRMIEDPKYMKATSLAMYPFLSSVNKKFHELVNHHDDACKENVKNVFEKPFIWILSGHDITIGPLFLALKIPLLHKVPYATRVAIELWVKCDNDRDCCDSDEMKPYVRILLNGKDVTGNIGHCGLRSNSHNLRTTFSDSSHEELCPLSYFNHFIKTDFFKSFNSTNYDTACRV